MVPIAHIWILRRNYETRIQAAEMKFLPGVARYMRSEHRGNAEVRKTLKVLNLNIIIQKYWNNWLQHLQRMEDYRIHTQACQYNPQ
jgi:hypothetical protein